MARWDLDPPQFFLPRMTADQVWSLDLAAQAPSEVLEVDVVMPEGEPASGAAVTLTGGRRDERGSFAVEVRDLETADLQGRARFALFGGGVLDRLYLVEAEHMGAYSSDLLVIDGPLGARAPLGLVPRRRHHHSCAQRRGPAAGQCVLVRIVRR
jgi:hypothetical protein